MSQNCFDYQESEEVRKSRELRESKSLPEGGSKLKNKQLNGKRQLPPISEHPHYPRYRTKRK